MKRRFERDRAERRSFYCPNRVWNEINKQTKDCISVSTYIVSAIIEKMQTDNPTKREKYDLLLNYPRNQNIITHFHVLDDE
jgi:hypothetical protein